MKYKTKSPQELADILIHAAAYKIDVLSVSVDIDFYVVNLSAPLPEGENEALRLYDADKNVYLSPEIQKERSK